VVNQLGTKPDPEKTLAISDFSNPTSIKDVRAFLGLAGFYRRYIKDFSSIATPLNALLRKDVKFDWSTACQEAVDALKFALTTYPVLHHPVEGRKFIIGTDASLNGLGAVLQQRENDALYPIAFASRSLKPAEKNYSVPELEALAIVFAVTKWRHYILGTPFDVETNQQSLTWLKTATAP
jgi:hypothetical protein